jgi:hypothetical protein
MSATLAGEVMPARRVTLIGLAKNTGKTEALTTLAAEVSGQGHSLGITSIGRDGEDSDAIQPQIAKPRIHCPVGTLVATTIPLIRRCGAPHKILVDTGVKTPLGTVVISRLRRSADVEVAGPSTAAGIHEVADAMLDLGAEHVLIDGSIDRRATSAPGVSDAVVLSTGAVLGHEIDEVAQRTSRVVELVDLPQVRDRRMRELAGRIDGDAVVTDSGEVRALPTRFALTASTGDIAAVLRAGDGRNRTLVIGGVLSEQFLDALMPSATRDRVLVVVADATKVFLRKRPPHWYRDHGIDVEVLRRVELRAITVNPVAPLSHHFSSDRLRSAIDRISSRVPVFDVRSHAYRRATRLSLAAGTPMSI